MTLTWETPAVLNEKPHSQALRFPNNHKLCVSQIKSFPLLLGCRPGKTAFIFLLLKTGSLLGTLIDGEREDLTSNQRPGILRQVSQPRV